MTVTFTDTATAVRDWLRNNAATLNVLAERVNVGTVYADASPELAQITVARVGGGDDASDAPLDLALIQIDVWASTYNTAKNVKNSVRALVKELRTSALNTGSGATTGYGARVISEIFSPDQTGGESIPRFALTVEVTARATN